jgi:hypothetical protein
MAYTDIDDPSAYFQTLLYTGNGADDRALVNDGNSDLQPDWIWFKERNSTSTHQWLDSSRGVNKALSSPDDGAEETYAYLSSFDSDGFTFDQSDGSTNESSNTFVAWQWKANGGTTASNTDGSITSTVQANLTAGFSIVTYTGTGSNATVGHGLGAVPDMVIVKRTSAADNWGVQLANALGNTNALRLNLTDSYGGANGAGWWNDTSPTSTTVSIGTRSEVNTNTSTYIMYCFKNIQGYSKFGSYIGNGNANGTFVYTGFKPAWVMCKSTASTSDWYIYDNKREGYNVDNDHLLANSTAAEATADEIDMLSNGFKLRIATDPNVAEAYVYMAFAEHPFVSSKGVPTTAR